MKIILRAVVPFLWILGLGAGDAVAQSGWIQQYSGTNVDLVGVDFTDTQSGTAVGAGGTILRTDDGGDTWTAQLSGTLDDLHGVYFIDAYTGIAVGNSGTILRTDDGGNTWTTQFSGTTQTLNGVFVLDSNTAWVAGDPIVLSTTDGGNSWMPQSIPTSSLEHVTSVWFVDGNRGTAVGYGHRPDGHVTGFIFSTSDGGASWTYNLTGERNWYYWVSFAPDGQNGLAVGGYQFIATVGPQITGTMDGGDTWSHQRLPLGLPPSISFVGVSMGDGSSGTAVGDRGTIVHTTNRGDTWTVQSSGTLVRLQSVAFVDRYTGTAVGKQGIILRTIDGGG